MAIFKSRLPIGRRGRRHPAQRFSKQLGWFDYHNHYEQKATGVPLENGMRVAILSHRR